MRAALVIGLVLASSSVVAEPPPGHPSVPDAQRIIKTPSGQGFPYKGRVLQAIDSNDYTYIEVSVDNGKARWLAAPRLVLQPNSWIGYGDGAVMRNFYSRKHHRTFDEVWFVSQVQVLGN